MPDERPPIDAPDHPTTAVVQAQPTQGRTLGDANGTLRRILADIDSLIPCDRALIWVVDEDGRQVSVVVGRQDGVDWDPAWSLPVDWPVFAPALRDGTFSMQSRAELTELDSDAGDGERQALHFLIGPIRDADHTFGILSLSRTDDHPFAKSDLQTLQTIAGLASIAIRSSLAIASEREQRRRVMQMGILTASLNQARTPAAVIDALIHGVDRLIGIQHCHVARLHPGDPHQVDLHLAEPLRLDGRAITEGVASDEHPVEAEMQRTRRYVSGIRYRELLEQQPDMAPIGLHGLAAIPIRNGTRLEGVLCLWSPLAPGDPGFADLPDSAIDAAETLCAQTAIALERTALQQEAQQAALEQRTLAIFSERLSTAVTSEEMAAAAIDALASMMPIRGARVSTVGAEGDADVLASGPGDGVIDDATCAALRMLERWVEVDTTGWSGPLTTWMPEGSADQHVLCWPVASDASSLGTLTILRDGNGPFATHELDLASHTSGQLALGLQRARSHTEAIIARDEAERNAGHIARMLQISNEMSRQHDLDDVLTVMDRGLSALIDFSVLEIYTADDEQERLDLIHFRAVDGRKAGMARLPYGSGAVGRAARLRRPAQGSRLAARGQTRVLGVPMVIEGRLLGIISIGRDNNRAFTEQELSLLGIFSAHAASELSRADLARQNRELYLGGIRALTSTVDAKDPHTRGHSARVGRMARLIAEELELPREDIERVELAGLLHDVGKIGIPDQILQKPGPLDEEERAIMMGHAEMGATILRQAGSDVLESLVPLVLHHHEWWDGRGYPRSLRGDDIPVGAQIIGVADAFDTMTNDRPYRRRSSVIEAWVELQRGSGTQFSPAVVASTANVIARFANGDDVLASEPGGASVEPLAQSGGQLGDLRSLGILVGLTRITSHLTDLRSLIEQALGMVAERLDLSLALVLSPDERHEADIEAFSHTPAGFTSLACPGPECVDAMLSATLPLNLESIDALADMPLRNELFRSPHNVGVVALMAQEETIGALLYEPNEPGRYWRSDLTVIETIAPHIAAAVSVARMHDQVREDALTDGLTGALNYRAFQRELADRIAAAAPFAVMMFDVVGLKPVNDTIGHLAGDQLLRHAAEVIRTSLGPGSMVARIGGDEFGAILVGNDAKTPHAIGQEIVERMESDVSAAYQHTVTLRFGWSTYPLDGRTAELLLHVADQRMYLNRPSGRDPDA